MEAIYAIDVNNGLSKNGIIPEENEELNIIEYTRI